jgi:hypothetical protein
MKNTILKQAIATAVLAMSATAASAQTTTFNFDYLANNGATSASTALPKGSFSTYGATPVGSLTLTDLADLGLGDGATGVRATITLNNLNQFGVGGSGTGAIFISSFELNFAGTGDPVELSSLSFRNVSGLATTGIEFAENGTVSSSGSGNNWGNNPTSNPAFGQEINYTAGTFTNGKTSTIDFLNGESGFNGFTVASLLANSVDSQNAGLPDAYAWIKIRSTGGAIFSGNAGQWWGASTTNAAGGRLDVLSIAAVPESDTYAMLLAGLGIMGMMVNRRQKFNA